MYLRSKQFQKYIYENAAIPRRNAAFLVSTGYLLMYYNSPPFYKIHISAFAQQECMRFFNVVLWDMYAPYRIRGPPVSIQFTDNHNKKLNGGFNMSRFVLCFIFDEFGDYKPVPYSRINDGNGRRKEFENNYFIALNDYLMEVSKEDYLKHYKDENHQNYLRKEAKRAGEISLQSISTFGGENIAGLCEDIAEQVVSDIMIENLYKAMDLLSSDEQRLIKMIYFEEHTIRQCAEVYDVYPNAIQKRKKRILEKLRKILEA